MRLSRLELTRYGKFTDQVIDFGDRIEGEPDLHIVYGPNEAGKSTALSAFLDLLYGIELRSQYNFVHPYPAMRVGAVLEIGGVRHRVARIKRPQNSLLDGEGQVVGDGLILGPLGGIDRDSYRARFSLDDETLETGGDAILQSRGDLGQALFSASAGLADLSQSLAALRDATEKFHKPHGRATELAELKAEIARLKHAREALDTGASKYAALTAARDAARSRYEETIAERGRLQSRIHELQRQIAALPRLADWRSLRERLAPLNSLPDAPADWLRDLPALREEAAQLAASQVAADQDIAERTSELAALELDETALQLGETVDGWADIRARAITAGKDIPQRQIEVHREDLAIAAILGRLGRPDADPRALLLPAATIGAVRALLETRSGIEADCQAALRELAAASESLEAASATLGRLQQNSLTAPSPGAMAQLAAAIQSWRKGDASARRAVASRTRTACLAEAEDRLADLLPWQGGLDPLARLALPDATRLAAWKAAIAAAENRRTRSQADLASLHQQQIAVQRDLASLAETMARAGDREIVVARAAREAAWARHRRNLDAASADHFEAAMRHDDLVSSTRAREEAAEAARQKATRDLAELSAKAAVAQAELQEAQNDLQAIWRDIRAATAAIPPAVSAGDLLTPIESWLSARGRALETRSRLQQAERELHEAETDIAAARDVLRRAMQSCGLPQEQTASDDSLVAMAQAAIDRAAEIDRLRRNVAELQDRRLARQRDADQAASADQRWRAEWANSCDVELLRPYASAPQIGTVREILAAEAELGPALDRRDGLVYRIEQMRQDEQAFAREVEAAARALGISDPSAAPLELDRPVTQRLQAARAARDTRTERVAALAQAERRQRDVQTRASVHAQKKAEMAEFFGVDTLAEIEQHLRALEQAREWRQLAGQAERDILLAVRNVSMTEAEALLDAADSAAMEAELSASQARFEDCDRRVQALFAEHTKAADQIEAVGGDEAVAVLEAQRRVVLLDIEERAKAYLRTRAGIEAAQRALHAFRQSHRSAMMRHASDAFHTISQGAYTGLASQPDRENEVLVAICADGSSKIAPKLSKGTRFQLYLALRVAGYHEFTRHRDAVPFIADDIMETFDDFRAEATLQVFADMSRIGQVIYLTHHRHLCDIARLVCPEVRLHSLIP